MPLDNHYLIYFYGEGLSKWVIIDNTEQMQGKGILKQVNKNPEEFPESYKLLPLSGKEAYQDIWNGRSWMNQEMKHPILHSTSFSSEEHRQNPKTQRLSLRICISTLRNIIKNNTHRPV